jgi:hypothetical protein
LEFFKLSGQGREQMLFGRKHRARFYGLDPRAPGASAGRNGFWVQWWAVCQ